MTNYCNPHTYYFSFSVFCVVRYFRLSLLNNFYCDILYLCNIVIPIINLVTSANLKKAGIWPAEIFFWKNKTRCSDQLCSCLWFFNLMPFPWNFGRQTPFKADRAVLTDWNRLLTVKKKKQRKRISWQWKNICHTKPIQLVCEVSKKCVFSYLDFRCCFEANGQ